MESLLSEQLTSEIVWAADEGVYQALESVPGQTRLSAATTGMSAPGKKRKFSKFVQKSIHRMSEIEGKVEVFCEAIEVRKVPSANIERLKIELFRVTLITLGRYLMGNPG